MYTNKKKHKNMLLSNLQISIILNFELIENFKNIIWKYFQSNT